MTVHDDGLINELRALLGERGVLQGPETEGYLEDYWGRAKGQALCIALPASTQEVSAVLSLCHQRRIAVFPQGGNTSTCLGAVPDGGGRSIVLSLRRMNKILSLDPDDNSVTAQAGCILAAIQDAARGVDRLFPLSLGAEGSCQVGGNVSTNAGGISVLRYGNTRDLVLGVEVVLPDGRIWNGLRSLRKNNTGYDLKHLFIGAEGSLGVITAVTLKLFPAIPEPTTVLIAFPDIAGLPDITGPLTRAFGSALVATELLSGSEIKLVRQHVHGVNFPIQNETGWFLLVDIATGRSLDDLNQSLEAALADAMEGGIVEDVIVAMSQSQRENIWHVRHGVTEAHKKYGMGMSHDIAVPIGKIPYFIEAAGRIVASDFPDADVCVVGHVGDGNLHYNVIFEQSRWNAIEDQPGMRARVYKAIYDIAAELDGTFSAEHGIGALHVKEMETYKSAIELGMMREIKALFDPHNLMNPGRVLPGIA